MTFASALNALVMHAGRGAPDRLLRLVGRLPTPMLDWLRGSALRRTVRLAGQRSRFYREKLASLGIQPGRVRRLSDLETCFTTPEELRAARPEELLCGTPETVIESSGTTGRLTRIYLSREELEYAAWQGIIFFAMVGIGPGDRILGAFDYSWGLGGIYTERILAHSGLFGVCPGLVDPQEAVDRLPAHGFTVIIADPFWLSRLTEVAMARGIRTPMKAFISGAERITDNLRAQIEAYWRAPLYMSYGSTELGATLGGECRAKQGYHLNEYDFAVEVVDADEDGYGEVVFTTLNRSVMPLIRYRTRDIARFIPEPCVCGLPFRRLSPIRGRCDEVIACVWGDVHPDVFADLLCGAPGLGDEWQVALTQPGLRPVFEFRLEVEGGVELRDPIVSHIHQRLARQYPPLWAKFQQRMCDIDVRLERPGSLRTGRKLRRLVDERDSPKTGE